jgi:hypothetical protein
MDMLPLVLVWFGGFAAGAAAGYVFYIIKTDPSDDDDLDDPDAPKPESFDYYFDNRDSHK